MKLVSILKGDDTKLGIIVSEKVYDLSEAAEAAGIQNFPDTMAAFLKEFESNMKTATQLQQQISEGKLKVNGNALSSTSLAAPVPHPTSCRDGYAFRQHVAAARRNRRVEMIPEFDEYPIFYFTNHNAIQGPGDIFCMPDHFEKLDFELEASIVINRFGRNIPADEADDYIAGLMIMNDLSARTLQMEEMKLNLGPAKGKDFSTAIGPMLVTLDELAEYEVPCKPGHTGKAWNLDMTCKVNGVLVSQGNLADMDWTFAEIIERCSYGANIFAGDVIGSGTVGTGCFLELNGTGKLNDPNYPEQWLKENDTIEMEITGLGILKNSITKEDSDLSLLALKKKTTHES